MKHGLFNTVILCLFLLSCRQQSIETPDEPTQEAAQDSSVQLYYDAHHQDSHPGKSLGTVSSGSLEFSTVVPFEGDNFIYFDTSSYLAGRAHCLPAVSKSILAAYNELKSKTSHRFVLMELSNKMGGKIYPHHTHQNGRSADFMSPLLKNGAAYEALDLMGGPHYLLEFTDDGFLESDSTVQINFELIAQHLLVLDRNARKNGLKIEKVIWKMELKNELFSGQYGQQLKARGIYVTRNLTPLVNSLHDDHYHVDFAPL